MDPIINIVCILFAALMTYVGFRHDIAFVGYGGILLTILQAAQLVQGIRARRRYTKAEHKE